MERAARPFCYRMFSVALVTLLLPVSLGAAAGAAPVHGADHPALPADTWTPVSSVGAPSPREGQSAVWTGTQMIVWGGWGYQGPPSNPTAADGAFADGASYDPATDTWTPLPTVGAPRPRFDQVAAWTGSEMLIWGGSIIGGDYPWQNSGARYRSASHQWLPMSQDGAPSPRYGEAAVWTGHDLLVWGGNDPHTGARDDGARYDPATDTWTALPSTGAPSPSAEPVAVWTGSQVLVWGGQCPRQSPANKQTSCVEGARYDPAADRWLPMQAAPSGVVGGGALAVWIGSRMLLWGGFVGTILGESAIGGRGFLNGGLLYDPATDTWSTLPQQDVPPGRTNAAVAWTGDQLLIWGGSGGTIGRVALGDGARYNPSSGIWTPLPDAGAPSGRSGASAVWTGTQFIIWGGSTLGIVPVFYGDGARYTPPPASTPPPAPHDQRYFPATRFRVDDAFWDYFTHRGGVRTFGYPRSREFRLLGLPTQFFQRRILQRFPDGSVHVFNLLDPGVLPPTIYTALEAAKPAPAVIRLAPVPGETGYDAAVLAFVQAHAPDYPAGVPVHFFTTFLQTVSLQDAFPDGGGNPSLLPLMDLELWGLPIGTPEVGYDAADSVYLRFQRGIMHYELDCHCTQDVPVADELRGLLTGPDPNAWPEGEGHTSRFYRQYDPSQPNWVRDPAALPATDFTNAFTPE